MYQERLVYFLECAGVLPDGHRKRVEADRPAVELVDDRLEDSHVHIVEAVLVHVQPAEGRLGNLVCDHAVGLDLCVIPNPAQQPVRHSWCPTASLGDLSCAVLLDVHVEDRSRPYHDPLQLFGGIIPDAFDDPESSTHRRSEHAESGRRTNQRKRLHPQRDGLRVRSVGDADVYAKFFHRRVEKLFQHRSESMDFVDEKHVATFQRSEEPHEITGLFDNRTAGGANVHPHFTSHQRCQRGLAEAGRTIE